MKSEGRSLGSGRVGGGLAALVVVVKKRGGGALVVSRSWRLTGDITLRHGWRDRGRDGYPSGEMSASRHC